MPIETEPTDNDIDKKYKDWHPKKNNPNNKELKTGFIKPETIPIPSANEPDEGHPSSMTDAQEEILNIEAKENIEGERDVEDKKQLEKDVVETASILINENEDIKKGFTEFKRVIESDNKKDKEFLDNFKKERPFIEKNLETYKILSSAENVTKTKETYKRISEATEKKKYIEAFSELKKYYEDISNQLPEDQKKEILKIINNKEYQEHIIKELKDKGEDIKDNLSDKETLAKIACFGADLIPVAGPLKMLYETYQGKDLTGEKIEGTNRIIHGLSGSLFLILDCTGGGVVATKIGQGTLKGGKVFTRFAAAMRVAKVSREVYTPVFKVGRYLITHPEQTKLLNKGVQEIIKNRKTVKQVGMKIGTELLKDPNKTTEKIKININ